jgi:hypothetical protein
VLVQVTHHLQSLGLQRQFACSVARASC